MPTPPGAVPSLAAPPVWRGDAACRSTDAQHFFAPLAEPRDARSRRERAARALCRACPVQKACLDYALRVQEPYGIWGGLTELERRRLLRARRGAAAGRSSARTGSRSA